MLGLCYGLNVPVPQSSCAEVLILDVMTLGGGAFGSDLGLDEVMSVEPGVFTRRDLSALSVRRGPSVSREAAPHRTLNGPTP